MTILHNIVIFIKNLEYKNIIMEIYGNVRQKVDINPVTVIENLLIREVNSLRETVFEKNGKFYKTATISAGNHSFDDKKEITKERYEYIKALHKVLVYLNKNL